MSNFYNDRIKELMARQPSADEKANLERHAKKLQVAIMENEWRLLEAEDMDIAEMVGLLQEQSQLQSVMQWFASIQQTRFPPRIQPAQGNGHIIKPLGN